MDSGSPIVPLTIAFFLAGMTLLGFVVVVVETWWVVAFVGNGHIVGSLSSASWSFAISAEERRDADREE